jgi:hypothetical protein
MGLRRQFDRAMGQSRVLPILTTLSIHHGLCVSLSSFLDKDLPVVLMERRSSITSIDRRHSPIVMPTLDSIFI